MLKTICDSVGDLPQVFTDETGGMRHIIGLYITY